MAVSDLQEPEWREVWAKFKRIIPMVMGSTAIKRLDDTVATLGLQSFMEERRKEFLSICDSETGEIPTASFEKHFSLGYRERLLPWMSKDINELEYYYLIVCKNHYPELTVDTRFLLKELFAHAYLQQDREQGWEVYKSKMKYIFQRGHRHLDSSPPFRLTLITTLLSYGFILYKPSSDNTCPNLRVAESNGLDFPVVRVR